MSNTGEARENVQSGQTDEGEVSTEALESVSGGNLTLRPIIGGPIGPLPIIPEPILPIEPNHPIDTVVAL